MADGFSKALEELDSMPVPERQTTVVQLGGRDITLRQFNETQFLQLQHEALFLQRSDDMNVPFDRVSKSISRIFRALRAAVPNEDEREFLDDLMAEGELELRELLRAVLVFNRETLIAEKPTTVRRGRPPRRTAKA